MSYQYDPEAGGAPPRFRFPPSRAGRQYSHTIRVGSGREAERADAAIEETIQDLTRGKLVLPADADPDLVKAFIISGGKVTALPAPPATAAPPAARPHPASP